MFLWRNETNNSTFWLKKKSALSGAMTDTHADLSFSRVPMFKVNIITLYLTLSLQHFSEVQMKQQSQQAHNVETKSIEH